MSVFSSLDRRETEGIALFLDFQGRTPTRSLVRAIFQFQESVQVLAGATVVNRA